MVDEKTLYDTFSAFGTLVSVPKIARTEDGASRGFGFISYDSFEAADKAIESMNNQYLMNKQIHVEYAFKKDGKNERHGDAAERLLAAQARKHNVQIAPAQIPAALFAPPAAVVPTPAMPVAGMPQMAAVGQMNPMGMGRGVPTMPMGMQQQYASQYQMPQQMPYQQPMQQIPPQQPYMSRPPSLPQAPPAGLPARPPPAAAPPRPPPQATPPPPQGFAGYSQPPAMPPGFGSAAVPTGPGGLPPRPPQPMGFPAAPPPGFGPPGQQPQGRGGHPPPPPMMPAGFNGYQQRR
jgi:splicing factor 3B subunit 4